MSNKLKTRPKKQRTPLMQSNQSAQAFGRAIQNCKIQLKEMEEKAYNDGFDDGKNWSDAVNLITLFYSMHELHGWGWRRYMAAIKKANEYIDKINSGETSMAKLVDELENKHQISVDKEYRELIERYGA